MTDNRKPNHVVSSWFRYTVWESETSIQPCIPNTDIIHYFCTRGRGETQARTWCDYNILLPSRSIHTRIAPLILSLQHLQGNIYLTCMVFPRRQVLRRKYIHTSPVRETRQTYIHSSVSDSVCVLNEDGSSQHAPHQQHHHHQHSLPTSNHTRHLTASWLVVT